MNDIEAERRRLATRLEQDIITTLSLLQSQTATYNAVLRNNPDAQMALTVLSSLVSQALQRTRYLQQNLHPTTLETLGLEPALEVFAADEQRMRGIQVHLEIPRLRDRLPEDAEVLLFRCVQMLIEHAFSRVSMTQATITLTYSESEVTLSYTDNGRWYEMHLLILQHIQQSIATSNARLTHTHQDETLSVQVRVPITESITLTPRELEIVTLAAQGLTNKQIAGQLHVSARTVNFHLDNVYSKLGVNSRTEAALYAVQQGWISNPLSD